MAESTARPSPQTRTEAETEFARIVAFTDGVMAIAITLLVLNIQVPDVPDSQATAELLNLWPAVVAYAISFIVIGRFWLSHHSFFGALQGFDTRLMVLNLFYLSMIVLIPFTTDVLDEYGDLPPAPILYSIVLAGASSIAWLINRHALRAGLVRPEQVAVVGRRASLTGLLPALVFVLSIPFALHSPEWTPAFWGVALLVSGRLTARAHD